MLTAVVVVLVALVAFAYVAVPLIVPGQADPLPDDRDPVLLDLEEEKSALLRAIRSSTRAPDLPLARREQLRSRYEAKAAKVLRALDEREAEVAGRPAPRRARSRRLPYGAAALLVLVVAAAAVLPGTVLPRVGDEATATTTQVDAARQLQALQRAARDDPSADNLLALGDAYWDLQQPDQAEAAYQKVVDTISPSPPGRTSGSPTSTCRRTWTRPRPTCSRPARPTRRTPTRSSRSARWPSRRATSSGPAARTGTC